ncbi:MAG TPA: ferritin [Bacteroidota bacterium]|nr:ferritin [Bacteroidota bacterium]
MTTAMLNALNEQINQELFSAYLYLSMAAHFEATNLPGMAQWMKVQAHEETIHAMKFYNFILDRGGKVTLKAIAQPQTEFKSPMDIFKQALEHEKKVTSLINKLYEQAQADKDYPAQVMLQWFINEQVEEEKNATEIVARLELIGESKGQLVYLDHELGKRKAEQE